MIQELLYTSAPRGLKPGSHGFCTVQCTHGMPAPLAAALEGLSGYRPVYPPTDARAALNPVVHSHLKLHVGGRSYHVLSRIADYGLDYSQRTNKLAHHVALEAPDRAAGGPAWMQTAPGFMQTSWDGEARLLPADRRAPQGNTPPAICRAWEAAAGDAGWAGVVAEAALADPDRLIYLTFAPGQDMLPLIAEALSLLPPEKRWDVTYSTYLTNLPKGASCQWRCVLADSPEANQARRFVTALHLDLTKPLPPASGGELVEQARTGRPPSTRPAIPAAALPAASTVPVPDDPVHFSEAGHGAYQVKPTAASLPPQPPPQTPPRPPRATARRGKKRWRLAAAAAILAALLATAAAYLPRLQTQAPNNQVAANTNNAKPAPTGENKPAPNGTEEPTPATPEASATGHVEDPPAHEGPGMPPVEPSAPNPPGGVPQEAPAVHENQVADAAPRSGDAAPPPDLSAEAKHPPQPAMPESESMKDDPKDGKRKTPALKPIAAIQYVDLPDYPKGKAPPKEPTQLNALLPNSIESIRLMLPFPQCSSKAPIASLKINKDLTQINFHRAPPGPPDAATISLIPDDATGRRRLSFIWKSQFDFLRLCGLTIVTTEGNTHHIVFHTPPPDLEFLALDKFSASIELTVLANCESALDVPTLYVDAFSLIGNTERKFEVEFTSDTPTASFGQTAEPTQTSLNTRLTLYCNEFSSCINLPGMLSAYVNEKIRKTCFINEIPAQLLVSIPSPEPHKFQSARIELANLSQWYKELSTATVGYCKNYNIKEILRFSQAQVDHSMIPETLNVGPGTDKRGRIIYLKNVLQNFETPKAQDPQQTMTFARIKDQASQLASRLTDVLEMDAKLKSLYASQLTSGRIYYQLRPSGDGADDAEPLQINVFKIGTNDASTDN